MKKMIALLLIAVLVCGMMATVAFASGDDVTSPHADNTTPAEKETSPQTGDFFPIGMIAVAAILLCGTAVVALKKAAAC